MADQRSSHEKTSQRSTHADAARGPGLVFSQVAAALRQVGLPHETGPYGFAIGSGFRLQTTSGIGQTRGWAIVRIRGGERWADMPLVTRVRALRWWLRAFLTGEPPPRPTPGFIAYPRLNHNRFGAAWVWIERTRS